MRHAHEQVDWTYVGGGGLMAVRPKPCPGVGCTDGTGKVLASKECVRIQSSAVLNRWMRDAREAAPGTQNWKLGHEALSKKASKYHGEKNSLVRDVL